MADAIRSREENLQARGVDAVATGAIDLFTTGSTFFRVSYVAFGVRAVSGLVSTPTLSIGVVGAGYTDIIPATVVAAGLNAVGKYVNIALVGIKDVIPPNTVVRMNRTVGANATQYLVDVHLVGSYV